MANEETSQQQTVKEHIEVVDAPGMTNSGVKALSSMFDKIAEGKGDGKSAQEVIAAQPREEIKPEVKEEVKEPEKKEEASELSKKLDTAQEKKDETKEEEVSREALLKATEEKKEEKKAEVKEVKTEDDVPEEELKVLPTDKPKTAKRIQSLLRRIETVNAESATTKKELTEKAAKLADLEKKLSEVKTVDPATDEKIKGQLDELQMYRRRYELDKDPEVKTKFDSRAEAAEAAITATLTRARAGKPLLDLIAAEGGWAKFADSMTPVAISDGEGGTKEVPAATLADQILQRLPLGERKAVEAAMMEQIQVKRDKERFYKEEQDKAVQYFKNRDELTVKQQQEQQKQIDDAKKLIDDYTAKTLQSDWLKDKEIPANATPSEKAAAEEHNKYNNQLRALYKKHVSAKGLPELLDMVVDSVRYYDERRTTQNLRKEVERLTKEVQAKQLEINKFKGGARSVPKTGSISVAPTQENPRDNLPKSISDAFDRIQRGERVTVGAGDDE